MKTSDETVEILNDLIEINNDRIIGYERALKELKEEDSDLKPLFLGFINQSRDLKNELGKEVQVMGGDMESGTTNRGKIYRAWMDVKAVVTGHDRHSVLASCEFGEDAAQRAYESALKEEILAYLNELIMEQKSSLREAHDEVKSFRDELV